MAVAERLEHRSRRPGPGGRIAVKGVETERAGSAEMSARKPTACRSRFSTPTSVRRNTPSLTATARKKPWPSFRPESTEGGIAFGPNARPGDVTSSLSAGAARHHGASGYLHAHDLEYVPRSGRSGARDVRQPGALRHRASEGAVRSFRRSRHRRLRSGEARGKGRGRYQGVDDGGDHSSGTYERLTSRIGSEGAERFRRRPRVRLAARSVRSGSSRRAPGLPSSSPRRVILGTISRSLKPEGFLRADAARGRAALAGLDPGEVMTPRSRVRDEWDPHRHDVTRPPLMPKFASSAPVPRYRVAEPARKTTRCAGMV